jgi:4-diphosphocytidyl-2-C-methyl-D-erythritol kinase
VTGRRPDGYHLLDSLAVFAQAGDLLSGTPAASLSLSVEGTFAADLPASGDNLVLRAARALAREAGVTSGARLVLTKMVPVASGIGGGSADAAAALRLLCRLWGIAPGSADLLGIALSLGADVPVCLGSRPAHMGGIGDRLGPAPLLPPCGMVLVNPGMPVATAAVFGARPGGFSAPAVLPKAWPDAAGMAVDLAQLRNDLESAAIAICPAIGEVLAAIAAQTGCLLARMSGSGATCFGLFPTIASAQTAARRISQPRWWSWGGGLTHD